MGLGLTNWLHFVTDCDVDAASARFIILPPTEGLASYLAPAAWSAFFVALTKLDTVSALSTKLESRLQQTYLAASALDTISALAESEPFAAGVADRLHQRSIPSAP